MFVLGFWIGRNILDNRIHNNTSFLKKAAITGYLIGLPLNIFFSMDNGAGLDENWYAIIANSLDTLGYICLTSAYAATFALLYLTGFRKFLDWSFNKVGKAALSNYLFQSVAGILLFYSAGLGLGTVCGGYHAHCSGTRHFRFSDTDQQAMAGIFSIRPRGMALAHPDLRPVYG
jgi:uncharacterized protein